jgi:hypothetical protein
VKSSPLIYLCAVLRGPVAHLKIVKRWNAEKPAPHRSSDGLTYLSSTRMRASACPAPTSTATIREFETR